MANPARKKGTDWEVELLPRLRTVFGPNVERAALRGHADHGDYVGTPLLVEAKSTNDPHFLAWAKRAASKDLMWVVCWHGDRRRFREELALCPLEMALALVAGTGSAIVERNGARPLFLRWVREIEAEDWLLVWKGTGGEELGLLPLRLWLHRAGLRWPVAA